MPQFIDQLNRVISLPEVPRRIVSLVPSQTELLAHLGVGHAVAGITKFCIHPKEWWRTKQRVGGTKNIDLKKIEVIQPDLVIANKEENVREQVEHLAKRYPVWVSDVNTLSGALQMIRGIGALVDKEAMVNQLSEQIEAAFALLKKPVRPLRVAYLIWKDPYITVGGDTFIHQMLEAAGFQNVFADKTRYPVVTVAEINNANCDCLLLSSEPYPFRQKHFNELAASLPQTMVHLVDGELFSWYSSRLLHAPPYFAMLHKQLVLPA